MEQAYQPIADLLRHVRVRRRRLVRLRALGKGALAAAAIVSATLLVSRALPPVPLSVALVGVSGLLLAAGVLARALLRTRVVPTDRTLALLVEERIGTLEERLVSAVDIADVAPAERSAFAGAMIADAARAADAIAVERVIEPAVLRRAGFQAAASVAALAAALYLGRHSVTRTYDATTLALFPAAVGLDVTPGDARVEAGHGLEIHARLVGNAAPVVPQLLRAAVGGDDWQAMEMEATPDGRFALALSALTSSFQYRVVAGGASSGTFTVSVVRAPRVASIDVDYTYPAAFGLAPRSERDGGDIYGPPGTTVKVRIHTDAPAATGQMLLADRTSIALAAESDGRVLNGALTITGDGSYRVALADALGLASPGDTEYFIRTMDDRPPDVHVVRPASDRRVTSLEEVAIDAEAADDFGVASLELVYALRGGKEQVVPLQIPPQQTTVNASHMFYLEDLDVRPGDFISYYVRARDIPRGRRAVEARSDIFFLEIKNFEEEFTLMQSQAVMGGGASNPQLDELVNAQKEVIVATWKLDRRNQATRAQSAQDVRAVANAESELKTRVERLATSLRTSVMRDPRARLPPRRGGPSGAPAARPAGEKPTEEELMTAAATAMKTAAALLNAVKTAAAIAPEMEALNRLLEAQSDIRKRDVQRQLAGAGSGSNRNTQDLSSLFDRELARDQQTNYENSSSAQTREEQEASAADKIRELAQRQDELLKRQQDLASRRQQLTAEDVKRELEKLTREQNDLRQRAEDVAQEIARQQEANQNQQSESQGPQGQQQGHQSRAGQQGPQSPSGGSPSTQTGQRQPTGGQPRPGTQNQSAPDGQTAREGGTGQSGASQRGLREATDEMRASVGELRRDSPGQAAARGQRALDRLRALEQQLEGGSPEGRRRAMGDLQLETRQLADAQRQLAGELRRAAQKGGDSSGSSDQMRRLAGEQERLADRLESLQQRLRRQGQPGIGASGGDSRSLQQTASEVSRDLDRQRLIERMQQSAEALRGQSGEGGSGRQGSSQSGRQGSPSAQGDGAQARGARAAQGTPQAQEAIARELDKVAERLGSGERGRDAESDRLMDQRARAQELRDRLNETSERLADLDRQAAQAQRSGSSGQTGAPSGASRGASSQGQSESSSASAGLGPGSTPPAEQLAQLRQEIAEQLRALRQLVGDARRDSSQQPGGGGAGATLVGPGMVLSAPGTEGFKQDFARWQEMKRQATIALESIESSASQRLQAKESKDRLATAPEDRPPADYQPQVDSYFKALASKKTP